MKFAFFVSQNKASRGGALGPIMPTVVGRPIAFNAAVAPERGAIVIQ